MYFPLPVELTLVCAETDTTADVVWEVVRELVDVVKGVLVDVCDWFDVAEPIGETDGDVDTVFEIDADDVWELLGEDELLCNDVDVAEPLTVELLVAVPDTVEDELDVVVEVADIVEVVVPDNVAYADEVSLEVASLDIVG